MNKTNVLGVFAIALLIVGALFVSAQSEAPASDTKEPEQASTCGAPPTCGADTCGGTCGGSCGIPSCGCSK